MRSTTTPDLRTLEREPLDGWHTVKTSLITPSGTSYRLKRLGKGAFSTAYEIEGSGVVISEVRDVMGTQIDFSKTILSEIVRDSPIRHLPHIVYLGSADNATLFAMPKYKVPLRKEDSPTAWKQATVLDRCNHDGSSSVPPNQWHVRGHEIRDNVLECVRSKIPPDLLAALETLSDYANNYGPGYLFEFPKRNLGTDEKGDIILLDVIFDIESLRLSQHAKRRNPSEALFGWFDEILARANPAGPFDVTFAANYMDGSDPKTWTREDAISILSAAVDSLPSNVSPPFSIPGIPDRGRVLLYVTGENEGLWQFSPASTGGYNVRILSPESDFVVERAAPRTANIRTGIERVLSDLGEKTLGIGNVYIPNLPHRGSLHSDTWGAVPSPRSGYLVYHL